MDVIATMRKFKFAHCVSINPPIEYDDPPDQSARSQRCRHHCGFESYFQPKAKHVFICRRDPRVVQPSSDSIERETNEHKSPRQTSGAGTGRSDGATRPAERLVA